MPPIGDLKKRALFRWVAAYIAVAWLTLEILGFLAENFFWPSGIVRGATVALATGLGLVVVLAWYHGEKGRQRVGRIEVALIVGLLGVGGSLIVVLAPSNPGPESPNPSGPAFPGGGVGHRSIAVLPFADLSPDPDNAFFADGVHETVLTQLSTVRELRVLSRAAVMRYRHSELTIQQIATELGAGTVLQGSVQLVNGQIRITAQLVDPVSEQNLWADQFDGTIDELFDVQSAVAIHVAEKLEAGLSLREVDAVSRPLTDNLDALDFYMRGRYAVQSLEPDDNAEAIRLYRLALAEDSMFAGAWAALGLAYLQRRQNLGYPIEWTDSAEAVARRSIALDSSLAEGYRTLGGAYFLRGRNAEATEWYRVALDRNPGLQAAMANLALTNLFTGKWDEALRWAIRAFERDPTSPQMRELLANSYQDLLEFEIAETWLQEALTRDPRSPAVRRQQQALEILRGNPSHGYQVFSDYLDESGEEGPYISTVASNGAHFAREFDDVLKWSKLGLEQAAGGSLRDYHDVRVIRAFALKRAGQDEEASELLAVAERDYSMPIGAGADSWVFPLYLSAVHLVRGSRDEGLTWLKRTEAAGFNGWNLIEEDPIFDSVRDDARYLETMAAMRERLEAQRAAVSAEVRPAGDPDSGHS